jgi:predicted RNA binding protein YcfA (HicA-like mRNA interferase family)
MLRFLQREGFSVVRIRGSHHFLNRGGTDTIVPVHGNRSLKTGTLRKILRDIHLTPPEFAERFNA